MSNKTKDYGRHSFELQFPSVSSHRGKVLMDGKELRGVTAVSVSAEIGEPVRLQLTVLPESVLVRLNEPEIVTSIKTLIAETTSIGNTNKTYVPAVPQNPPPPLEDVGGLQR